jgi:hypothetical protein
MKVLQYLHAMRISLIAWSVLAPFLFPLAGVAQETVPKKLTLEAVYQLWKAQVRDATEYHETGTPAGKGADAGAWAFRVSGIEFATLWNHYADLCGMTKRYQAMTVSNMGETGPKGAYVLAERPPEKDGSRMSVFLLKADGYTATVTIQSSAEAKAIAGTLAVQLR